TVRDPERRGAGAGGDEQAIDVAVIAAGKLDNDIASREATRQPQGTHRRLGARADHAHHLDARHRLDNQFGQVRLALGRGAEAGALVQRLLDGSHHARVTVTEDQRAPRTDIIEVGVPVDVVEISSLSTGDEDRLAADSAEGPCRAVHPAGNDAAGLLKRLVTPRTVGLHDLSFLWANG